MDSPRECIIIRRAAVLYTKGWFDFFCVSSILTTNKCGWDGTATLIFNEPVPNHSPCTRALSDPLEAAAPGSKPYVTRLFCEPTKTFPSAAMASGKWGTGGILSL